MQTAVWVRNSFCSHLVSGSVPLQDTLGKCLLLQLLQVNHCFVTAFVCMNWLKKSCWKSPGKTKSQTQEVLSQAGQPSILHTVEVRWADRLFKCLTTDYPKDCFIVSWQKASTHMVSKKTKHFRDTLKPNLNALRSTLTPGKCKYKTTLPSVAAAIEVPHPMNRIRLEEHKENMSDTSLESTSCLHSQQTTGTQPVAEHSKHALSWSGTVRCTVIHLLFPFYAMVNNNRRALINWLI